MLLRMPEDEGYCIAMYFAMALDEEKTQKKRKNRLLPRRFVWPSTGMSFRMFYRYP